MAWWVKSAQRSGSGRVVSPHNGSRYRRCMFFAHCKRPTTHIPWSYPYVRVVEVGTSACDMAVYQGNCGKGHLADSRISYAYERLWGVRHVC